MTSLTQKEMIKHIRGRIANAGIKARVFMSINNSIQVAVYTYETKFSADEQRMIKKIAIVNNLTAIKGMAIDPDSVVDVCGQTFWFYM